MKPFALPTLRLFSVAAILVLMLSAFFVSPALADGETPPPPEEGTTETAPAEESAEEAATEEPAPVEEEAAAAEESTPVEESESTLDEPVEPVDTPAEVFAALPESTDLVLINADGEQVSLASQEASEILYTGDPIWCPAGVAVPVAGPSTWAGGCSPSFPDFYGSTLWLWLVNEDPNVAGTIWVEGSYSAATALDSKWVLDGNDFTTLDNFAITIKGGWNGLGTGTINTNNPSSLETGLSIINWTGNVTISNIVVDGVTDPADANPYNALEVVTKGNIVLDRVVVNDALNSGGGVYKGANLDNTSGTGNVTINNSSFVGNEGQNLTVNSFGNIALKNVTAGNSTTDGGAYMDNSTAATPKTFVVSNSDFSGNANDGLVIYSKGAVTLSYVTATFNTDYGTYIGNAYGTAASPVSLNGINQFSGNGDDGLYISSQGPVKVNQTTANDNGGFGVSVSNTVATLPQSVTFTGFVAAIDNNDIGIRVFSKGMITLTNVTAAQNLYEGVYLDNDSGTGSYPVMITGTNLFHDNNDNGLTVIAKGAVTLYNVTSIYNAATGVEINNTAGSSGGVSLFGNNVFHDNQLGYGLYILSDGSVVLNYITSVQNTGTGVYIDNTYNLTALPVSINGTNLFQDNTGKGLDILSRGAVTINNVTSKDNNNLAGVSIDNTYNGNAQAVTFNGTNLFEGNAGYGLEVLSRGNVSLNNVTAIFNSDNGINIDNTYNGTAQTIYLKGTTVLHDNFGYGAQIYSRGLVSINNVTANLNGQTGLYIDNTYNGNPQAVSLTGNNNFIGNTDRGLEIYSRGAITTNNVSAASNGNQGVSIDNTYNGTALNVTMNGINSFRDNSYHGLELSSRGTVTLSNVTAINNGNTGDHEGVYVYNRYSTSSQVGVNFNGTNVFNNNSFHGASVESYGAVVMNNVTAFDNGTQVLDNDGSGVYIVNDGGTVAKNVSINGVNQFHYNEVNGLNILSDGAITLSKASVYYNGETGAELNNFGPMQSNVTISGYGMFENNGYNNLLGAQNGLSIVTHGAVTLANITATFNNGSGVVISSYGRTTSHAVTFSGTNNFSFNGDAGTESGLYVETDGNITISNMTASNNYYRGAELDNYEHWFTNPYRTTATPLVPFAGYGSITLSGFANFVGNQTGDGLWADTHGSITTTRVYASSNGDGSPDRGITMDADLNITMTCTMAFGNDFRNLDVDAVGTLTLKGLISYGGVGTTADILSGATVIQTTCP